MNLHLPSMSPMLRPVLAATATPVGAVLGLAVLAGVAWRCVAATHARRLAARPAALPEPEQVWEDEGGQNQMADAPAARP